MSTLGTLGTRDEAKSVSIGEGRGKDRFLGGDALGSCSEAGPGSLGEKSRAQGGAWLCTRLPSCPTRGLMMDEGVSGASQHLLVGVCDFSLPGCVL